MSGPGRVWGGTGPAGDHAADREKWKRDDSNGIGEFPNSQPKNGELPNLVGQTIVEIRNFIADQCPRMTMRIGASHAISTLRRSGFLGSNGRMLYRVGLSAGIRMPISCSPSLVVMMTSHPIKL